MIYEEGAESMNTFVVICTVAPSEEPNIPDLSGGTNTYYMLAGPQVFESYEDAQKWAIHISSSRKPLVIPGDWLNLQRYYRCEHVQEGTKRRCELFAGRTGAHYV